MTAGHTAGPIEMAKEEINNFIDSPSYDPLSLLSFIHPLDKDIGKPLAFKAKIGTIFTSVCLDTGAGLNAISAKFLSQPGLKTTKKVQLDRPMFVQVGNSAKAALNEAVFLSLDVRKKSDSLWFLVVDKLPLNVLIGATSARRLGIEIRKDATYWDEIRLINSKGPETQTTDLLSMKAEFWDKPTAPVDTRVTHNITIPPRHQKVIEVVAERPEGACEGYLSPNFAQTGKLHTSPGLVRFDAKTGLAKILVANLSATPQTLTPKKPIGQTMWCTSQDAAETDIVCLSKRSFHACDASHLNRGPDKHKKKKENERNLPEDDVKVIVDSDYIRNLPEAVGESNVDKDSLTVSPINLAKVVLGNDTPHYVDGWKSAADPINEDLTIDEIISLLSAQGCVEHPKPPTDPVREKVFQRFEIEKTNLSSDQVEQLIDLLLDFKDLWDDEIRGGKIKHTPHTQCDINLEPGVKPRRGKVRQTSPQEDELVKDHINKMYQRDVIRPSNSSWASPILLVQKKNGKTRFCVDYRKLNEVSIKDAYPLPRMDDIFSVLGKASYYSTIDLTDAFWSIRVREEDIPKTAFITKYGLWEFISMPFGLTNAPATQQRFIEAVLQGLLWECCFAYIDDILCYSNSFRNHTRDLRNIFSRLRENNLIIQPPKCALCRPAFEILGYVATPDGIKPSKKKLEALKKFPLPASVKETQSFLGIVSWFRRFIENCSARSQHLRACASVKDPSKFKLTPEAKKEFELLKEVMATEPCLAHPKLDEQLYIHVDASIAGLGAILTQPDNKGRHRVIEYASKAYDSSTTTGLLASNSNCEAHGTIWALDHFKYYVKGRYPIVYCDCKCLSQVLRSSATTPQAPKLKAWVARMLEYCPRVVHKPGKLMAIPDALSRMHMAAYCSQTVNDTEVKLLGSLFSKAMENEDNPRASLESQEKALQEIISHGELDPFDSIDAGIPVLVMTRSRTKQASASPNIVDSSPPSPFPPLTAEAVEEELDRDTADETVVGQEAEDNLIPAIPSNKMAAQQREDPYLVEIISYLSFGLLPRNRTRARYVKDHSHEYMIDEDSILRRVVDIDERSFGYPAMVPWALRKEIVQSLHDHPTNGHRKYEKLLQAFQKAYWFEGMRSFIKNFCDSCTRCQRTTIPKKSLAPLKPFRAGYPGMVLQLDCTPGPKHKKPTERGNSHILAILESFSNHVRLFAVPDPNAKLMAECLLAYISVHSMPLQIITDNGPEFANQLMTELALMLGLKHSTASTSFVFVALLNKQQIVDCDRANNYGRPELFVSDFSARAARFGRRRRRESFVC